MTGNQIHYALTIASTQDLFCRFWRATTQREEINLSFICAHNTDLEEGGRAIASLNSNFKAFQQYLVKSAYPLPPVGSSYVPDP